MTQTRETEAIQEQVDEQIGQISYELKKARDSFFTLENYIRDNLLQSPTRNELRRTATTCHNIIDTLIDTMGNAPSS